MSLKYASYMITVDADKIQFLLFFFIYTIKYPMYSFIERKNEH